MIRRSRPEAGLAILVSLILVYNIVESVSRMEEAKYSIDDPWIIQSAVWAESYFGLLQKFFDVFFRSAVF